MKIFIALALATQLPHAASQIKRIRNHPTGQQGNEPIKHDDIKQEWGRYIHEIKDHVKVAKPVAEGVLLKSNQSKQSDFLRSDIETEATNCVNEEACAECFFCVYEVQEVTICAPDPTCIPQDESPNSQTDDLTSYYYDDLFDSNHTPFTHLFDEIVTGENCAGDAYEWLGSTDSAEMCAEVCKENDPYVMRFVWAERGDGNCKCASEDCQMVGDYNSNIYEYSLDTTAKGMVTKKQKITGAYLQTE